MLDREMYYLRSYRFLMVLSFMFSLLFILMFCCLILGFTETCQHDGNTSVSTSCTILILGTSCLIFAITCPCLLITFEKINQSWYHPNEEPDDF